MVEVDEMHSYIGSKKTAAGFGLLLIDMERDFSISLLATGETKRQKNSTARDELYCKRPLEALRKCNSQGKAYTIKSRNFHSGRV